MTEPRVHPITDPSAEVIDLYDKAGLRAPDGSTLNIFATLAHHPKLLRRWMVFAGHVLSKSSLSPRDRELAILRVGVVCDAPYEFGQHYVIGLGSDISVEEIEQVRRGPDDPAWSDKDAATLRAVDELHTDSRISDATWRTLGEHLSTEQVLDLIFAIGNYHLVSFALNSLGVELDGGIADTLHAAPPVPLDPPPPALTDDR